MLRRWNFYLGIAFLLASIWGLVNHIFWWEQYYFAFAWMGYFFLIDALGEGRWGSSLITRQRSGVITLFILSAPFWLLFRVLNLHFHLWSGEVLLNTFESELFYSIAHMTVIPSYFATFYFFVPKIGAICPEKRCSLGATAVCALLGVVALSLAFLNERLFFPLIFCFLPLIFDPINYHRGRPSVFYALRQGNWKVVGAVAVSGLMTGIFWEGFNAMALGGWDYKLPYFNFTHLFSMPLLGFLGYIPFGISIFSFYYWFESLMRTKGPIDEAR